MADTGDSFDDLWAQLAPVGRDTTTNGYRRFAWTAEDAALREWFAATAAARGLDVVTDAAGNQWAWTGDPDAVPGVVVGSHLDSVPDGGAFDGPLGVVSAFLALDVLRARGITPTRPVAIVHFVDEEGARFGVPCAGSRMLTGALPAERALGLRDADGTTMAEAMRAAGHGPRRVGRDEQTLRRVACLLELHVEQGRGLVELGAPVAVGTLIRPHGRWRFDVTGRSDHAGTTRLADRQDAMLGYAAAVLLARRLAERHGVLATCGKVQVRPNGVNAVAGHVTGWLDARGDDPASVQALVREFGAGIDGTLCQESWTDTTRFDADLVTRLASVLADAPLLSTGAGHDAGILAADGVPAAMLFVRNPTGVSHSPDEYAERDDCLRGVHALADALAELAR